MKKRIIVGLITVAAVAGGLPYATGYMAEKQTEKAIVAINAQSGAVTVETIKYERSYNKTYSEYKWVTSSDLNDSLGFEVGEVVLSCETSHKMLGVDYSCHLKDMGNFDEQIRAKFKGNEPVTVEGSISLIGTDTSKTTINPFEIVDESGTRMVSGGAIINSTSNSSLSELSINGQLAPIQVSDGDEIVSIDDSTLSMNGAMYKDKYFIGDNAVNFGDITVANHQLAAPLVIKGLIAASEADIINGMYKGSGSFKIAEVSVPASLHARSNQDVALKNIDLGMSFDEIPFEPVAALSEYFQTLSEYTETDMPEVDEQLIKEQLIAVLKKDLGLKLWLKSDVNEGKLDSYIDAQLTQDITEQFISEMEAGDASSAMKLLDMIDLDVLFAIPNSVIDISPEVGMIAMMSNKFVPNDSGLSAKLVLKDGAITLNGKPTSVEQLMQ